MPHLSNEVPAPQELEVRPIPGDVPLSPVQRSIWIAHQLAQVKSIYNISELWHLDGDLNARALWRAVNEIVTRQAALRIVILEKDDGPFQRTQAFSPIPLSIADLTSPSETAQSISERICAEGRAEFKLEEGQLFRPVLYKISAERHALQLTFHHLVTDGWSSGLFIRELEVLYAAYVHEQRSPLPPLPIQYTDYALQESGIDSANRRNRQLAFWSERLQVNDDILEWDVPDCTTEHAPAGASEPYEWCEDSVERLRNAAKDNRVTFFMAMLAVLYVLLHKLSRKEHLRIAVPTAGRRRFDTENLIGCFVNTLILRASVSNEWSFARILREVKRVALDAYANQDAPLDMVVAALRQAHRGAIITPYQVMFALQPTMPRFNAAEVSGVMEHVDVHGAQCDLSITLWPDETKLRGWVDYKPQVIDVTSLRKIMNRYETLAVALASEPTRPIGEVCTSCGL